MKAAFVTLILYVLVALLISITLGGIFELTKFLNVFISGVFAGMALMFIYPWVKKKLDKVE
jgi:hypothetical protein